MNQIFLSGVSYHVLCHVCHSPSHMAQSAGNIKIFFVNRNICARQIFAQVGVCKDLPCLLLPWIGSTLVPPNNTIYMIPITQYI